LGDEQALLARLDNSPPSVSSVPSAAASPASASPAPALQRLADVPIYATDALVRRAEALQLTKDARAPTASLPTHLWLLLGLKPGDKVRISQGSGALVIGASEDSSLVDGVVRVPAGHPDTAALGAMFGVLRVEKA